MGPDGLQTASSSQTPLPLRTRLGLLISAAGALVLASMVWKQLQTNPAALNALLGGSVAALATALGALPVLLTQHPSERTQDTLFGFGAGVMLAACAFSLILPDWKPPRQRPRPPAANG